MADAPDHDLFNRVRSQGGTQFIGKDIEGEGSASGFLALVCPGQFGRRDDAQGVGQGGAVDGVAAKLLLENGEVTIGWRLEGKLNDGQRR